MLFFVFLFIAALFSPTTGDVIALGDTDFHQALESQEIWFVEFYAPWCNFCQKLAPVWHELSKAQADVKIAKIDCTKSKSLCGKDAYDITIYPTFKYIKVTCRREEPRTNTPITSHLDHPHLTSHHLSSHLTVSSKHGTLHDYLGSRSKDALLAFVKKIKGQAWTELTDEKEIEDLFPSPAGPSAIASSESTDNGVVFLLTLHAPRSYIASVAAADRATTEATTETITDRTTDTTTDTTTDVAKGRAREVMRTRGFQEAMDGLSALETAFQEVAHTMHSTTSFAILYTDTSSTLVNLADNVNLADSPVSVDPYNIPLVGAKLERLERHRPAKTMTDLPHVAYYIPTDNTDNQHHPSSSSSSSVSEPLSSSEPLSLSLTESLHSFVHAHNYAFITALDAHNFRHLADLHKMMVIAVVEGPNPRDIVTATPAELWESNKYHHVDRHGLVHALDFVASQYTPLLTPTTTNNNNSNNNNNATDATDSLLFGYIPAKQWKKWLKQYGCQRVPALLLLGLDYREPGWVFKCFQLDKFLTEKEQADKGSDKGSDKNKNKDKVQKIKVVDWPGATNALQRKLARVVSKVLTGDMQYTNKVKIGYGFFFSLVEHVMSRFNAYYPWSMLVLVPVLLIVVLCVVPSPKLQHKRKRD